MKKIQVALLAMTASTVLLVGCDNHSTPVGGSDAEVIETQVTGNIETNTSNHTTETQAGTETIDDSIPPEEGMVRSKVTNEWIDGDLYNQRPLAVMIPNESSAIPHYGLSEASIIYEANVEGRMTRMMAIFEDYESIEKLGNIRSLRDYYAYWAFEWVRSQDDVLTLCLYGE